MDGDTPDPAGIPQDDTRTADERPVIHRVKLPVKVVERPLRQVAERLRIAPLGVLFHTPEALKNPALSSTRRTVGRSRLHGGLNGDQAVSGLEGSSSGIRVVQQFLAPHDGYDEIRTLARRASYLLRGHRALHKIQSAPVRHQVFQDVRTYWTWPRLAAGPPNWNW